MSNKRRRRKPKGKQNADYLDMEPGAMRTITGKTLSKQMVTDINGQIAAIAQIPDTINSDKDLIMVATIEATTVSGDVHTLVVGGPPMIELWKIVTAHQQAVMENRGDSSVDVAVFQILTSMAHLRIYTADKMIAILERTIEQVKENT